MIGDSFSGGSCVNAIDCSPKGIEFIIIILIVAVNLASGPFCMSTCPSS